MLSPRQSATLAVAKTQRYGPDDSDEWMENNSGESEEPLFVMYKSTHHPLARLDISEVSAIVDQQR